SPRALRAPASQTTFSPYCRLDQQATGQGENSLNFHALCLILIDTHRASGVMTTEVLVSIRGSDLRSSMFITPSPGSIL
ncbi:MAG TPA: hypothetical protein VN841_21360, partial [Bryobacteraceae bacterium]|nr:hypothetical protein [Bryobacteraceae bacterium]